MEDSLSNRASIVIEPRLRRKPSLRGFGVVVNELVCEAKHTKGV